MEGFVGSRDENMMPSLEHCWGFSITNTENVLAFYVVQESFGQMLKNFKDNGRVTLVLFEWPSHRSFQFKGQFLEAREMTPDEVAFQKQFREKPIEVATGMGYPFELIDRYVRYANLAIEFKVEKVFDQTPGPGAGKAIELAK